MSSILFSTRGNNEKKLEKSSNSISYTDVCSCANAASFGESADKRIEVTDLRFEQNQSFLFIKGIAVNHSSKQVKSAFVKFNLYDENNALVAMPSPVRQTLVQVKSGISQYLP